MFAHANDTLQIDLTTFVVANILDAQPFATTNMEMQCNHGKRAPTASPLSYATKRLASA